METNVLNNSNSTHLDKTKIQEYFLWKKDFVKTYKNFFDANLLENKNIIYFEGDWSKKSAYGASYPLRRVEVQKDKITLVQGLFPWLTKDIKNFAPLTFSASAFIVVDKNIFKDEKITYKDDQIIYEHLESKMKPQEKIIIE